MTFRPILLTLALTLASGAHAGETAAAPDAKEQATLQSYADAHPACAEWSDGCTVCKRGMAVYCSTPGIACQPREIACKTP
jgi:hypothetical protein